MTQKKLKAVSFGNWGEGLACWFLRAKGYRIIARNMRNRFGEIDIIARRRNCFCFIEVKSRPTIETASEVLSAAQQNRILKAAQAFLSVNQRYANLTYRFDLIAVAPWRWPRHIQNAWLDTK